MSFVVATLRTRSTRPDGLNNLRPAMSRQQLLWDKGVGRSYYCEKAGFALPIRVPIRAAFRGHSKQRHRKEGTLKQLCWTAAGWRPRSDLNRQHPA
jgi:hypothetical protein